MGISSWDIDMDMDTAQTIHQLWVSEL
jgi:hypothetical protein